MTTYTYNRENWTGETATVSVHNNGTFTDSVYGKGKWKHTDYGDGLEVFVAHIDGVPFKASKYNSSTWYCEAEGLERGASEAIVAIMQVASNTM
jgi:hypothetical protein